MFHFSSNHKVIESVLMRDEKLCRNNMVISSQTKYINKICRTITNTKIKRSHKQKQCNKTFGSITSNEHTFTKYNILRQELLHSKCKHQKHILLQNNDDLDYILQSHIYMKSSPQFVLRVRDIFMQSYASKLIKKI